MSKSDTNQNSRPTVDEEGMILSLKTVHQD